MYTAQKNTRHFIIEDDIRKSAIISYVMNFIFSSDNTGAQWCYLPLGCSTCTDQRTSSRFPNSWSYEACATPSSGYDDVDNTINQRINQNNDDDDTSQQEDDDTQIIFSG